jgi:hypothetical protein
VGNKQFEQCTTILTSGIWQQGTASTSDTPVAEAWHGAEAYHFWLHAHRELYAGRFDQAMKVLIVNPTFVSSKISLLLRNKIFWVSLFFISCTLSDLV